MQVNLKLPHQTYPSSTYSLLVLIFNLLTSRGMDTLSGEVTLSKVFCLPSEKGSTLKGKNLLPVGANSFLLELIPFQKGFNLLEHKEEVTKVVSLV